jgi:hypothetical protein
LNGELFMFYSTHKHYVLKDEWRLMQATVKFALYKFHAAKQNRRTSSTVSLVRAKSATKRLRLSLPTAFSCSSWWAVTTQRAKEHRYCARRFPFSVGGCGMIWLRLAGQTHALD